MKAKRVVMLLVGLAVMTTAGLASAQRAGAGKKAEAKQSNDDFYEFKDDSLTAGGLGPSDATIRLRPGVVRSTLIRPRTSFVPEMLKTVENI